MEQEMIWQKIQQDYCLSADLVDMARKLGINPKKFDTLAQHREEPMNTPLCEFIRHLYKKRFNEN